MGLRRDEASNFGVIWLVNVLQAINIVSLIAM